MLENILFAIWFLLPAGFANASPIFIAAVPFLKKYNTPIDGGKKFRGHDLLGPHKTWRGIITGIIVATLTLWVQQMIVVDASWAHFVTGPVNYAALPVLILGPLFAIGALGGDAVESFFKRRIGIKSGKSWIGFDQLDYVVGAIIITLPFVILQPIQYVMIIIVWFLLHLTTSFAGWMVGLKKEPM